MRSDRPPKTPGRPRNCSAIPTMASDVAEKRFSIPGRQSAPRIGFEEACKPSGFLLLLENERDHHFVSVRIDALGIGVSPSSARPRLPDRYKRSQTAVAPRPAARTPADLVFVKPTFVSWPIFAAGAFVFDSVRKAVVWLPCDRG